MWGQKKNPDQINSSRYNSLFCGLPKVSRGAEIERREKGQRNGERQWYISLRRSFSYFRLREERVAKRGIFFLQPLPSLPSRGSFNVPKTREEEEEEEEEEREFLLHALSKK